MQPRGYTGYRMAWTPLKLWDNYNIKNKRIKLFGIYRKYNKGMVRPLKGMD